MSTAADHHSRIRAGRSGGSSVESDGLRFVLALLLVLGVLVVLFT